MGKHVKAKSYTTACDWLLATAPILHLLDVWSNKDHFALGHADLSLVVASGAVNLSGHIPKTAIAVETWTIPGGGIVTVSHAAEFVTALGNPPVKYQGAQALDYSGSNPPGLGEFQVAAGVYTFNLGDVGQKVVISYAYSTGSVDDAAFFAVLGVAAEIDVDESFADFGDPAEVRTTTATQRRWLWNTFWDPPEVFEPAYGITSRAPWEYTAAGMVINVDSSLNGKTLFVRVAFRLNLTLVFGGGSKGGSKTTQKTILDTPLMRIPFGMQFEPQLGSGSEYVNHPEEQVVYPDCSGVASDRLDLGVGASYPQMSFEATGYYSLTADGDANPADLLLGIALLGVYTNPDYTGNTTITTLQMLALSLAALGLDDGVPVLAPLDDLRAFCEAYGIYVSAPMQEQRSAADWFNEICEIANSAVVASGFQIKIIPYCERSEVGAGVTYTAPTAAGPVYDFADRDYADRKQPVIVRRKRSGDQFNLQPIAYTTRDNDYSDAQTTGADQGGIYAHMTQRAQPKNYKTIFVADVADKVGTVLVKKSSIQANEYEFKISSTRFPFIEAMDLVTLTDIRVGLNKTPVRITEANEDSKHVLTCKAEDFFYGLNAPQQTASALQLGTGVDTHRAPGPVNDPPIFVEVPQLGGGGNGDYLSIGLSGASPDWGGAMVWASVDGTTYTQIATQVGRSVMGLTAGAFSSAADPDTTNDLPVDLSESLETLDSFSTTYEDAFLSLCYIESGSACIPYELIGYAIAQLTSPNHYTLKATGAGNKLRRGVYATPIGAHASASKFLFLGGTRTRILIDPKWFGTTVHFKFTSFNSFGNEIESLADVTDYPYTIPVPCTSTILGGRPDAVIDIPATSAPNFSIAHGLAATPKLALIQMTAAGKIWFQSVRYDATNINLVASDAGLTGKILVYSVAPGAEIALAPSATGNFDVAHGLTAAPAVLLIQLTSAGEIWAEDPFADGTNLHLTAELGGETGFAILWQTSIAPTSIAHALVGIPATPFPGNFAIAHGLGVVPTAAYIRMTSGGEIWFQPARYDATYIYLVASDSGLTGSLEVFA